MKTIIDYQNLFNRHELTPEELYQECMGRVDGDLNAYITFSGERAGRHLKTCSGKLRGIPVAVKDNIHVKGLPTTCASGILEGFIPPYSATVTARIESEGGIIVGKTNMDEFAMGSSTEHSHYGLSRNPYDRERVPGGSSGGSAVAVANGSAVVALGSDTGGSVRQPASYCGLVGIKPTYGRVSRYGLVAFASSLDQIGVIGRNSYDVGLLLSIISGRDEKDSTSVNVDVPNFTDVDGDVRGIRIGIPEEYMTDISEDTEKLILKVKNNLEKKGAVFCNVKLPSTDYVISTYQIISSAEASSNLARYDGIRYGPRGNGEDFSGIIRDARNRGFLNEVKRRILVGTFVLSSEAIAEYYERALKVRTIIKKEIEDLFSDREGGVDYLLSPTTPYPAFKIGERKDKPLKMHLSDRFTAAANLAGVPAISAPAGLDRNGLPVGYQVMGKPFDEKGLLNIVRCNEKDGYFENGVNGE